MERVTRMPDLKALQQQLGYTFSQDTLLKRALTHRSVEKNNNERLEFLGDAILSFVIADFLYGNCSALREGQLSRVRSGLVNGEMLADLARDHGLGRYLILGQGERASGGHERDSILANAVEALIAAVYLDGGIDAVRSFILDFFGASRLELLIDEKLEKDPKSALQEWAQARRKALPEYASTATGPAHQQVFHVICSIEGIHETGSGESTNRRKAERIAAKALLDQLTSLRNGI